jgi:hypothetical protein
MITIKRVHNGAKYTLGIMSIDNEPFFLTLEEPWKNNERSISCIPKGHYRLVKHRSKKFGDCYRVTDLAGREPANRSGILIHAGNTINDTSGCILLGLELGYVKEEKAVLKSKEAYNLFMSKMSGIESCELILF